jgi:hypothetical protein
MRMMKEFSLFKRRTTDFNETAKFLLIDRITLWFLVTNNCVPPSKESCSTWQAFLRLTRSNNSTQMMICLRESENSCSLNRQGKTWASELLQTWNSNYQKWDSRLRGAQIHIDKKFKKVMNTIKWFKRRMREGRKRQMMNLSAKY